MAMIYVTTRLKEEGIWEYVYSLTTYITFVSCFGPPFFPFNASPCLCWLCFEIKELELLNVQKNIKKNSPLKRSSKFDLEGRRIFAFSWFVLLSENGCGNENKQTTSNTRFGVRSEVERQPLLLMKQF